MVTYTGKVTVVWLSSTVVNVLDFMVGIVVFLGTTTPKTSPCMATPRDNGATSNNKTWVFSFVWPVSTAAWTAAPYATASSGLIDLLSCLPPKYSLTRDWILGIRVDPPTRTISSTFVGRVSGSLTSDISPLPFHAPSWRLWELSRQGQWSIWTWRRWFLRNELGR